MLEGRSLWFGLRPRPVALLICGAVLFGALVSAEAAGGTPSPQVAGQAPGEPPGTGASPTLRDVIDLSSPGIPMVSPDGLAVVFTVSESNWQQDRREASLWMAGRDSLADDFSAPVRLDTPLFSGDARYCGEQIAYIARGEQRHLVLISPATSSRRFVGPLPAETTAFACDPAGGRVGLAVHDPEPEAGLRQRELFGPLDIKDEGLRNTHLWVMDLGEPRVTGARRLTSGDFTVGSFAFSPDGRRIAFDHAPDPHPNSRYAADISVVDLPDGRPLLIADHLGRDTDPMWSPDGDFIVYSSLLEVPVSNLPTELMMVAAEGGTPRLLTGGLATEPEPFAWNGAGIWLTADAATARHVYRLDPDSGETIRVDGLAEIVTGAAMSADGDTLAVRAESRTTLPEVLVAATGGGPAGSSIEVSPHAVSDFTRQVAGWPLGSREIVRWNAADGLSIEGVLLKPEGFDPSRKHPLMVVVHGGPRSVSRPQLLAGGLYPVTQWLARGAVVMMPNYRGSVGYGPEFRAAHHRTVGSGDAMDVLAGVEELIARGFVDEQRVALMGWSYGGFISAYLTATSDRFRAISVGAGISDWPTHYAGEATNITTLVFSFGVPPYEDPEAWDAASPMTHIAGARTPTLIQHVDGDPVVTVLNAYELHWALKNLGVETRFIEYRGSGHGPTGLRQRLGVLWHNQEWFARHIWDEQIELPEPLR